MLLTPSCHPPMNKGTNPSVLTARRGIIYILETLMISANTPAAVTSAPAP